MKIGRGISELWGVENRPLPLTWPMAYTTACTTVQAVILQKINITSQATLLSIRGFDHGLTLATNYIIVNRLK